MIPEKESKDFLLNELINLLPENFPPGIYTYIENFRPELLEKLNNLDSQIHEKYMNDSAEALKAVLREYWTFHNSVTGDFIKTKKFIESIPFIPLSELSERNMAIEVYSEVLKCKVWFCSNNDMVSRVRNDIPDAICYTVKDIRNLLTFNATTEMLKRIHSIKKVFPYAEITEAANKDYKQVGETGGNANA